MSDPIQAAPAADPWTRAEDACAAALELSQQVGEGVEEGVDADVLVPLLRRQHRAVTDLHRALDALTRQPHPGRAERRDRLGQALQQLLHRHDVSVDTLSARGLRLGGRRRIR